MEDTCIDVFNSLLMICCVEVAEYVAREGEPGDGVYFIWEGEVYLFFMVVGKQKGKVTRLLVDLCRTFSYVSKIILH